MKERITQKDYDNFYDGIMSFVRNKYHIPYFENYSYCLLPEFFTNAQKNEELNLQHKDEISLTERKYGRFIDEQYKLKYIHAMCYDLNDAVKRLQWEISVAIRERFDLDKNE